jgi:hypothetical protein
MGWISYIYLLPFFLIPNPLCTIMTTTDKFVWTVLTYVVSLFIIAPLTFISWLLAFAHNEGASVGSAGVVGYYAFYLFRFPTHNLIDWFNVKGDYFFIGLILNIFINAGLMTWIVITVMTLTGKFKAFE